MNFRANSNSLRNTNRRSSNQEGEDCLHEKLKDLQIREAIDRQRLIDTKKSNEKLREELNGLRSQVTQLEKAREINQTFFQKNEKHLATLKKRIDKETGTLNLGTKNEFESLLTQIRMVQEDHRESVNGYTGSSIDISTDEYSDRILLVLKSQLQIAFQQLCQKEQDHDSLHQKYYQSWVNLNTETESLVSDIKKLVAERKLDIQAISVLERKKIMLEAGLNLQTESVNSHDLVNNYASSVIEKIQESDVQHNLDPLAKKLRRNTRSRVPK